MIATLTVTGRASDRDTSVLADAAHLVCGSDLHRREGWQILTPDGWQTITKVEGRPWSTLNVHTVESEEPWIRSTDPDADRYLAQVRERPPIDVCATECADRPAHTLATTAAVTVTLGVETWTVIGRGMNTEYAVEDATIHAYGCLDYLAIEYGKFRAVG